MPKALEPGKSYPVVLDSDKDKHIDERPTFFVKTASIRQHEDIIAVLDSYNESGATVREVFDRTVAKLSEVVTGWKNMRVNGVDLTYSPDQFRDVLDYREARELLSKVAWNNYVSDDEKKD